MNRRELGITAVVLIALMAIVANAGLDNLPRRLRESVDAAAARLDSDRKQFEESKAAVERALRDEPDLFRAQADPWRERLSAAQPRLAEAATQLAALQALAQANRRSDAGKVEEVLARLESLRTEPVRTASALRQEAGRWLTYKRELPRQLETMKANYEKIDAFDVEASAAAARKAILDWPGKRADLEQRLAGLSALQQEGRQLWDGTAELRAKAEANQTAGLDYSSLFQAADGLNRIAKQLPERAAAANTLAAQLYESWDKLLLEEDSGRRRVRVVRTRFPDATLANGQASQEERWETAPAPAEAAAGMVIERKSAGKYDSEAERVVQPPAYAYIAPPGQSNAYGSWHNGVWTWLPQYLILSRLLQGPSSGTLTAGDFDAYRSARRRGSVFYGRNDQYRPRWDHRRGGSDGLRRALDRMRQLETARERPRGFSGSRYASRGTFSGSRYRSRGGFGMRSYSRGFRAFRGRR
jgi:hypothetical protein